MRTCLLYSVGMVIWASLEMVAFLQEGKWAIIASRVWIVIGISFGIRTMLGETKELVTDCNTRKILLDIAFVVLILPYLYVLGNLAYSDINPDGAQQVTAGLNALKKQDFGYTDTAFIGYPCRQYVLAAVPSVLLGHSVFAFHFGFAWLFLLGMLCFCRAICEKLEKYQYSQGLALIPISMIAVFPFIPEYYMNFEQAIIPVSLSLLGTAQFLRTEDSNNPMEYVFLAWIGGLMSVSYTPALAGWGLLVSSLVLRIIRLVKCGVKKNTPRIVCNAGCLIYVVLAATATFLAGRDDRVSKHRDLSKKPWKYFVELMKRTFVGEGTVFWGLFGGITIILILFSFLGMLRIWDFLCAGWIIAVVFFADWLIGYADYERIWNMQRQMVVVPVLVIFLFNNTLRVLKLRGGPIRKRAVLATVLLFYGVGIYNFGQKHQSFAYFKYIRPMKYVVSWINETKLESGSKVLFLTGNGLEKNVKDYGYFFPEGLIIDVCSPDDYSTQICYEFIFSETPIKDLCTEYYQEEKRICEDVRYDDTIVIYRYKYNVVPEKS